MGKATLQEALDAILVDVSSHRDEVDTYEHIYPVNGLKIINQVKKAIEQLDPTLKNDSSISKNVNMYTRELYTRFKKLSTSGRVKTVKYVVEGTEKNFIVHCYYIGPRDSTNIFGKINEVRTGSAGRSPLPKNLDKLSEQDKAALERVHNYSPLSNLRHGLLVDLFNIEMDRVNLEESSKTLDVIVGARNYDKETGKFIGRRSGLLHLGHLDGFAVVERKAERIISTLKERFPNIEIGRAVLTKSTSSRKVSSAKSFNAGIFGEFSLDLEVDVTLVSDEFAGANIAKEYEQTLISRISKSFLARKNWSKVKGSLSMEEAALEDGIELVIDTINNSFPKKNLKSSGKNKKSDRKPTKVKAPIKVTINKTTTTGEQDKFPSSKKSGRRKVQPEQLPNWYSLLGIINRKLPEQVAKNMHAPRLVYRTGTFANSAQVVNVETTKDGYPSIIFDYQRNPYDVFDKSKGSPPWNTPARDPRALVDKSVREIVQEMAIGRFYTRRA